MDTSRCNDLRVRRAFVIMCVVWVCMRRALVRVAKAARLLRFFSGRVVSRCFAWTSFRQGSFVREAGRGSNALAKARRKVRILHAGNLLQSFSSFFFLDETFKWKMLDGFVIFFFFFNMV